MKYVAGRRLIVACDVSGGHPTYIPTMRGLVNNCTRKRGNPIMLTFGYGVSGVMPMLDLQNYIRQWDPLACNVLLYITAGCKVIWPVGNVLGKFEQYVHLLDISNSSFVPSYVKILNLV